MLRRPILAILVSALWMSACSSMQHEPPVVSAFESTKNVAMDFETAWGRAVAWFATRNITIDKVEKESGLLTARYDLAVDDNAVDVGRVKASNIMNLTIKRMASINVLVRKLDARNSAVTVNVFGSFEARGWRRWENGWMSLSGTCASTGKIEADLFAFMGG